MSAEKYVFYSSMFVGGIASLLVIGYSLRDVIKGGMEARRLREPIRNTQSQIDDYLNKPVGDEVEDGRHAAARISKLEKSIQGLEALQERVAEDKPRWRGRILRMAGDRYMESYERCTKKRFLVEAARAYSDAKDKFEFTGCDPELSRLMVSRGKSYVELLKVDRSEPYLERAIDSFDKAAAELDASAKIPRSIMEFARAVGRHRIQAFKSFFSPFENESDSNGVSALEYETSLGLIHVHKATALLTAADHEGKGKERREQLRQDANLSYQKALDLFAGREGQIVEEIIKANISVLS